MSLIENLRARVNVTSKRMAAKALPAKARATQLLAGEATRRLSSPAKAPTAPLSRSNATALLARTAFGTAADVTSLVAGQDGKVRYVKGTPAVAAALVKAVKVEPRKTEPKPRPQKSAKSGGCGSAIAGAVKSVGKAVSGAAKAVGNAVSTAAKAVGKGVATAAKAVGGAVSRAANWVADTAKKVVSTAIDYGRRFVKDPLGTMKDLASKAWEGLKAVGKAAVDFWNKYGDWVIMGLTVVCAVVPGTQGLAVALAAYQAVKGGVQVYQGIKEGDWKKAVMGGLSVVTSFAGGVGALGAKAVGQGLFTAANIAGKVATVAQRGVILADAIKSGNPAGIIGAAAGTVAGGLDVVGGKAAEVGAKLATYGYKAMNVAAALESGQWDRIAAAGLQAGATVAAEVAGGDATVKTWAARADKAGTYLQVGGTAARAVARGDVLTAVNTTLSVAGSVAADLGADRKTAQDIGKGARFVRNGIAFSNAVQRGDAAQIAWLAADMGSQAASALGSEKAGETIAKIGRYAKNGVDLAGGIASGDATRIAGAAGGLLRDGAADLGGDAAGQVADKIAAYGEQGTALANAVAQGDIGAAQSAATMLGTMGYGDIQDLARPDEQTAGGAAKGAGKNGEQPRVERRPRPSTVPGTRRDGASPEDAEFIAEARAALTVADRATYERLERAVAGNPRAQRALAGLLTMDTLTGNRTVVGSQRLIDVLGAMTTQTMAGGIDRNTLIQQTLIEMDDPQAISQMNKNTCGATVVQMTVAHDNPAEYARIVAALASPAGRVALPSGQTATRVADWQSRDGGRSIPSRLIQPAFMNLAAASSGGSYDNTRDQVIESDGRRHAGLYNSQEAGLLRAAQGGRADEYRVASEGGSSTPEQMMDAIGRALAARRPAVALVVDPRIGGHYVQVTAVSNGRVYYQNPWGQLESMSVEGFKRNMRGLTVGVAGDTTLLQRQLSRLAG